MPAFRLDEGELRGSSSCPEIVLWREVVVQALRDLSERGGARKKGESDRVETWVGTQNFFWVCFNANLEPGAVVKVFSEIIKSKGEVQ